MNRTNVRACQSAFRDFARVDHWTAPHAVTLTMKQGVKIPNQEGPLVFLTSDRAVQNYRHFLNVLNAAVFGKAAKRFGKRVNAVSTIEGGNGKRLHIHAVIDCPSVDLIGEFPIMVAQAWEKTQWGHREIDIQPGADSGWINYISKFGDKPIYADAIDWENYHNADCWV